MDFKDGLCFHLIIILFIFHKKIQPPTLATAGNDINETTRRRRIYGHLLHPNQTPLRSLASVRAI
jgi:hypothetical protein